MNEKKRKKTNKPGRPPLHAAYSLMVKAGDLPKRRTHLRAYLSEVREALIFDLGPTEADLTAGQRVLVNGVISKLSVTRCIEEFIRENGVFVKGELSPVLAHSYLAYTNSLRLDLQALGIDKRKGEEIVDLGRYIEEADRKSSGTPNGADSALDTTSREIGPENAFKRNISVNSGPGREGTEE